MLNRLTFVNVIGILLENKKKTYQQYQLIADLFSLCLLSDHQHMDADQITNEAITYSRWCTGSRPIPMNILKTYEEEDGWDDMADDFENCIIPNLINVSQARSQIETLIHDSIRTIGVTTADTLLKEKDNAAFFTAVIRYAILSDHNNGSLYSPDLSDTLLGNRLPSVTKDFTGRKEELKAIASRLNEDSHLFITGMAGIGKSELVKTYAHKNKKKYTNIIYLYYSGNLKHDIASLTFADDQPDLEEEALFAKHYATIQKLHTDSLLIIDNMNILPKDEPFLRELLKNDIHIIITSRCKITNLPVLAINELKAEELKPLFFSLCPAAKKEEAATLELISEVQNHTLTVCMSALTMLAGAISAEDLLLELRQSRLSENSNEIEVFKDEHFSYDSMLGHLRKLLMLNRLSDMQKDILRNLCLLPTSGILKNAFGKWLALENMNQINELIRYGIISEDTENQTIALHPVIQEVALSETSPAAMACKTMLDHLHLICIAHGLDVKKPVMIMNAITSIINRIIMDDLNYCLLFLQDAFPYFEKYQELAILLDLIERMEYILSLMPEVNPCDKALLLDYKAWLLFPKKEYDNAIKKYKKAISILENAKDSKLPTLRFANLLSNLHNNLSTALFMKGKKTEAADELKKAFAIRKDYAHLGTMENNDTIQQTMHLAGQLMAMKNYDEAEDILNFCESIIKEYMGSTNLDFGICKFYQGIMLYHKSNFVLAEKPFLEAHTIFEQILETTPEHNYLYSSRKYLYSLYMRMGKPELARQYKSKQLPMPAAGGVPCMDSTFLS